MKNNQKYIKELKDLEKNLKPSLVRRKEQLKGIIYYLENNPSIEEVKSKYTK